MTDEPYEGQKIPDHWATSPKRNVVGKMVAVSGVRLRTRGTKLMFPRSRSFPRYSIVEITATDQEEAQPGDVVNSVLYLGFFEVLEGGIIVVGESVRIGNSEIGEVTGFSDVHEPNHLNILVSARGRAYRDLMKDTDDGSLAQLRIRLEDEIVFGRSNHEQRKDSKNE